jgi:hypothetical protein
VPPYQSPLLENCQARVDALSDGGIAAGPIDIRDGLQLVLGRPPGPGFHFEIERPPLVQEGDVGARRAWCRFLS